MCSSDPVDPAPEYQTSPEVEMLDLEKSGKKAPKILGFLRTIARDVFLAITRVPSLSMR